MCGFLEKRSRAKELTILRNRCHRPDEGLMDLDDVIIAVFCAEADKSLSSGL